MRMILSIVLTRKQCLWSASFVLGIVLGILYVLLSFSPHDSTRRWIFLFHLEMRKLRLSSRAEDSVKGGTKILPQSYGLKAHLALCRILQV